MIRKNLGASADSPLNAYQRLPFFYGWIIVAASSLGMLFSIPGQTIGVSVFTDYLIDALGMSRDQLSLAYMIGTLASASILSFSGILLDRWGSRKYGIIVSIFLGLLLIGLSYADSALNSLQSFFANIPRGISAMILMSLGFFFLRFLGQGSMTLVSRNMPMRWFTAKRGMVSAIVGTFVSFGFNAAPALYDLMIQAAGWKGAWRISGTVVLLLGSAMFAVVVRESPESLGLTQDGSPDEVPETAAHDGASEDRPMNSGRPQADLKQALRDPAFWIFSLGVTMSALYVTGFTFHVVSVFGEAGLSRTAAVGIFIPISVISVIVNIGVSAISDRIRLKWILVFQTAGLILSMSSVALLRPGLLFPALIVLGNGISGGTFNALTTLVWPRRYGTHHLGAISGFALGLFVAGSALGPFLLSASLSLSGSYAAVSIGAAAVSGVILLCGLFLREAPPK